MTRFARATIGLATMIAVVLALATPAAAHTELLGTSPAQAAVVTSPIEEVTLTFSGPVLPGGSSVIVSGPDGQDHSTGELTVLDFVVHQPVTSLASGSYRVAWTVIAGDGHPMTGEFTFQLALPPETDGGPTTAADADLAADSGGSGSGWWWLAAAIGLAVVGVGVLLGLRAARTRR
jgi:methionine-rich copper-binding protein CopC